ncbi:MAG: family metallophosphoesterase, partial [Acidimicrobiales bacterium]|nr:family metallophosphoesterase [Acidimicrobiales bacterium]
MTRPADDRRGLTRRQFLASTAASAAIGWRLDLWTPARARELQHTLQRAAAPAGTTLAATVVRRGGTGYLRLADGPGWPVVLRDELAAAKPGREARRRGLAALVHLTDAHVIDAQSPGRVEFLDALGPPFTAAFRPQEALSTQVLTSMVARVNALKVGPITGRPLDCAVSTGDNIDNAQVNELDWFITALDGGRIVANSGDRTRYEGVQDALRPERRYWHPAAGISDTYKSEHAFPSIDGLLDAAIAGFDAPGLDVAWYSTHGNHDGLIQGNLGVSTLLDEYIVGNRKVTDVAAGRSAGDFLAQLYADQAAFLAAVRDGTYPQRAVTADPERRTIRRADWVRMHLRAPKGPHGYDPDALASKRLWFSFAVAPGVLGVSLDTCSHGGAADGSLTQGQLDWLQRTLAGVHSRYLAADGTVVRTGHDDQLVLVFSHHTAGTMNADVPDPDFPAERRVLGAELVATLHRYPNVVGWVNGHTHMHGITAQADPSGRTQGFWEVNTASHIDYPEHARVVELVDNADGTLSLCCTVIEHAAAAAADHADLTTLGLASISRELSANDPQGAQDSRLGGPEVHNVELMLSAPFLRGGIVAPATTAAATIAAAAGRPSGRVPVAGELVRTGPSPRL